MFKKALVLSLFSCLTLFSQKNETILISGFIKDSLNKPIKDCLIFSKVNKAKVKTNSNGFYFLKLTKKPEVITFFSQLHGLAEVPYNGHRYVNINFKRKGVKINNKKNKNYKNPERFKYLDFYAYLRGKVPGVQVFSDNSIRLRGVSSLNGNNEPLFVLNGVAINKNDIESIHPSDIKKIDVLKGADATQFGIRGGAGVISIVTY